MIGPPSPRAARATLLGCAWVTAVALAADPADYAFVPDPEAEGASPLSGATWTAVGPGFTLHLQRIDEAQRQAFIEKVTSVASDPFAAPRGARPRFLTFVLELENSGSGPLEFRAQQCWLVTNRRQYLNPLTLETLRADFSLVGGELAPVYERTGAAFIPPERLLAPGERLVGLLVYNMPEPETRRYKVEIQVTAPTGDVGLLSAPYRRVRLEGEKGR